LSREFCGALSRRCARSALMTRLTVLYGHPTDPAEFDRYYREVHLPLARRMRGLTGWTIGRCQAAAPGERPPYYLIVGLFAETRAALEAVLDSPEGRAAVADVPNFATGGATFMYDDEEVLIPCRLD
jgi:uncharacterized protein (TIGR02118 family)